MIDKTINEIEAKIRDAGSITADRKRELVELLGKLKQEVGTLPATHADRAESIAGFTRVSTHEAMRGEKDAELLDLSLKGLRSSAEGFEKSHPQLVQVVNTISHALANLGI